jgi:hypothetical protein
MPTTLYPVPLNQGSPGIHRGINTAKLDGVTAGWVQGLLRTTAGTTQNALSATSVAGPTVGIELSTVPVEFISLPLAADVTIAGSITVNYWGRESVDANAVIGVVVDSVDCTSALKAQIAKGASTTELAILTGSYAVSNYTLTPTSTLVRKGERLRVRFYMDDHSSGNMIAAATIAAAYAGAAAGVSGDTYLTFAETITFQTTVPTGTILYMTDIAGPVLGATDEREMWTARGAASVESATTLTAGFGAPIPATRTAGGTAIEWYTKPLQAFTLDGLVRFNMRGRESASTANISFRPELAVCNADGSGAVVYAAASLVDTSSPGAPTTASTTGELTNTDTTPMKAWLAGPPIAVAEGQRLRLRMLWTSCSTTAMGTGTGYFSYGTPTPSSTGDSWIQLPQTVVESAPAIVAKWGSQDVLAMQFGSQPVLDVLKT